LCQTRTLRFLEPDVYASLLHPLDLGRQLLSQPIRLLRAFPRGGRGFGNEGVSHSAYELHVYQPIVYGFLSVRLAGVNRVDGVHRFMLKALEVRFAQKQSCRLQEIPRKRRPANVRVEMRRDGLRFGVVCCRPFKAAPAFMSLRLPGCKRRRVTVLGDANGRSSLHSPSRHAFLPVRTCQIPDLASAIMPIFAGQLPLCGRFQPNFAVDHRFSARPLRGCNP
jgi:hypothetical protein